MVIAFNSLGDVWYISWPFFLFEVFFFFHHSFTSISQRSLHYTVKLTYIKYETEANYQYSGMQCSYTERLAVTVKGTHRLSEMEEPERQKKTRAVRDGAHVAAF